MSVFANIDLLSGIKTKWDAALTITTLIPTSRLYLGSQKGGQAFPYCRVTVKQESEPERTAPDVPGSTHVHTQRVMFEIWAYLVEEIGVAGDAVAGEFNGEFTVPFGGMIDWQLVGDPDIVEDGERDQQICASRIGCEYDAAVVD
jgi:hypothetical protein